MDNEQPIYPNRIGKFSISMIVVQNNPNAVRAVMARCIVVRCELMYFNRLEYVALCDEFDEVPLGEMQPEYEWLITKDEATGIDRVDCKKLPYMYPRQDIVFKTQAQRLSDD